VTGGLGAARGCGMLSGRAPALGSLRTVMCAGPLCRHPPARGWWAPATLVRRCFDPGSIATPRSDTRLPVGRWSSTARRPWHSQLGVCLLLRRPASRLTTRRADPRWMLGWSEAPGLQLVVWQPRARSTTHVHRAGRVTPPPLTLAPASPPGARRAKPRPASRPGSCSASGPSHRPPL